MIAIFNILSLQYVSLLIQIFFDFFISILQFLGYNYCTCFVRFKPKHFIFLSNHYWCCIFNFTVHVFTGSVYKYNWFFYVYLQSLTLLNLFVLGVLLQILQDFLCRQPCRLKLGTVSFLPSFHPPSLLFFSLLFSSPLLVSIFY